MIKYARLARPVHWIKNAFVLTAVLFSGDFVGSFSMSVFFAAISFCLVSSFVYCLNDVVDSERDAVDPRKMHRPVASGEVSRNSAIAFALLLLFGGLICAFAAAPLVVLCVGFYALLNIAYSLRLKNIPVIDVFCIAFGFGLRVLAGGPLIGIPVASELLLSVISLCLSLGFVKRFSELSRLGEAGPTCRPSLAGASRQGLLSMSFGFMWISLTLYAVFAAPSWILSASAVCAFIVCARFLWLVSGGEFGEDVSRELAEKPDLLYPFLFFVGLVLAHSSTVI